MYYANYLDFRNVYNIFFDDKEDDFNNKTIDDLSDLEILPKVEDDALQAIISSLPLYKRDEIYQMVNLRVKSWNWKNKDKCEIIQSSDGVTGVW